MRSGLGMFFNFHQRHMDVSLYETNKLIEMPRSSISSPPPFFFFTSRTWHHSILTSSHHHIRLTKYTHIHIHIRMQTRTHAHTHTYTHTRRIRFLFLCIRVTPAFVLLASLAPSFMLPITKGDNATHLAHNSETNRHNSNVEQNPL